MERITWIVQALSLADLAATVNLLWHVSKVLWLILHVCQVTVTQQNKTVLCWQILEFCVNLLMFLDEVLTWVVVKLHLERVSTADTQTWTVATEPRVEEVTYSVVDIFSMKQLLKP